MEPPFCTMHFQVMQGWGGLFIPIAHSIISFFPGLFQDWPSPAVGDVSMSSTVLTCLCYQWLHSRSTSSSCARRRGRSSLSSRTEMWWKWTQNLVTFVCVLSTFFCIYLSCETEITSSLHSEIVESLFVQCIEIHFIPLVTRRLKRKSQDPNCDTIEDMRYIIPVYSCLLSDLAFEW